MAPYRTARAQKIPSCHAGEPLTRSHQSATGAGRGAGAASIAAPARREILSKGEVQGQHQKASSLRQGKPVGRGVLALAGSGGDGAAWIYTAGWRRDHRLVSGCVGGWLVVGYGPLALCLYSYISHVHTTTRAWIRLIRYNQSIN